MSPQSRDVLVRVTAGPSYDTATHKSVSVNTNNPTTFESDLCSTQISVKVQDYRGLPHDSPPTDTYFKHALHKKDRYSISFQIRLKRSISGTALVFGNDIDHSVRDKLPYGTSAAFKILKSVVDPGLEGDLYADKPHLYGCALSSFNVLWVGDKSEGVGLGDEVLEEGGDEEGVKWREERGVPGAASKRKNWYLGKGRSAEWEWEAGRTYRGDFFNPYLDFNDFSLRLPGFSLSVLGYLGGEDYLRYVMKDNTTGEVLFAVVFSLVNKDDVEGKGHERESQEQDSTATEAQTRPDDVD